MASILDLGAAAKLAGVVNRGRVESPCCEWESGYMGLVMGGEFEVEDLCKPWLSPCFPGVFFICNISVPFLLLETSRGNFFLLNLNKMKRSLICHMLWRLWGGTVRVACRPGFRCGARLTRSCFCFRKFLVLSPLLFFLRKVEVPPTCSQSSEAALELSPETSGDRAPL